MEDEKKQTLKPRLGVCTRKLSMRTSPILALALLISSPVQAATARGQAKSKISLAAKSKARVRGATQRFADWRATRGARKTLRLLVKNHNMKVAKGPKQLVTGANAKYHVIAPGRFSLVRVGNKRIDPLDVMFRVLTQASTGGPEIKKLGKRWEEIHAYGGSGKLVNNLMYEVAGRLDHLARRQTNRKLNTTELQTYEQLAAVGFEDLAMNSAALSKTAKVLLRMAKNAKESKAEIFLILGVRANSQEVLRSLSFFRRESSGESATDFIKTQLFGP